MGNPDILTGIELDGCLFEISAFTKRGKSIRRFEYFPSAFVFAVDWKSRGYQNITMRLIYIDPKPQEKEKTK